MTAALPLMVSVMVVSDTVCGSLLIDRDAWCNTRVTKTQEDTMQFDIPPTPLIRHLSIACGNPAGFDIVRVEAGCLVSANAFWFTDDNNPRHITTMMQVERVPGLPNEPYNVRATPQLLDIARECEVLSLDLSVDTDGDMIYTLLGQIITPVLVAQQALPEKNVALWRDWPLDAVKPLLPADVNHGMFFHKETLQALITATPSGNVSFERLGHIPRPCVVTDTVNDNWFAIISPWRTGVHCEPAKLPEWAQSL